MSQRDRYIHIYSVIEMSLMYRDSWWNTDIRFWRVRPFSLHIIIVIIDLEHEHFILWFGRFYAPRMVENFAHQPYKNTERDNDSQFYVVFQISLHGRVMQWNILKKMGQQNPPISWHGKTQWHGYIIVFILDVYDYTEVLSWRMFWKNVSEPSQNVDAWMFLWPVTGLGFGWTMDWLWCLDTQKKSGYLTVSHVEVSPKCFLDVSNLADIACMEHLRTHGF